MQRVNIGIAGRLPAADAGARRQVGICDFAIDFAEGCREVFEHVHGLGLVEL
ncbi:hypothetical protein D3C71_2059480 [compost metagenome]